MAMPMSWENNPRHPYKWKRYLREFCTKNFLAMRMYSTRPQRSQRPGGIAYQSVAEGVLWLRNGHQSATAKKLKEVRVEALRAGFKNCWEQKDFKTIVTLGDMIPQNILLEDEQLLMYYDIAKDKQ